MSTPRLAAGEALALQRRLPQVADRLALYAALADDGRRKDTFLLERTAGPTLLMDQAALRIECRGPSVELRPLTEGGQNLIDALAHELQEHFVLQDEGLLELMFPDLDAVDARERLLSASPFDVLRKIAGLGIKSPEEPFTLACLGVLAYDHVDLFETLPRPAEDPLGFPDFIFWVPESLIVFDPGAKPRAVCIAFGSGDSAASERAYYSASQRLAALVERCEAAKARHIEAPAVAVRIVDNPDVDLDDAAYRDIVLKMKEHINAGDIYQVVPSRTYRAPCPDPLRAFSALRGLDPSPYQFFVAGPEHVLFGCSPETAVRVFEEDGRKVVEIKPIAGTRKRGATDDEDDRMEAEMRVDHKETAEHMMLVDLARNDVARVSIAGTRHVAKLMTVERYARVMHLVSSVVGDLRPELDALHALQAGLNVGTLTGAPKIRAMELLREYERTKRGPYGGAIGWLNGEGQLDTGIVIRSAVVKDGTAFVRAGGGVVYDSDPQHEADEARRKASAVLSALAATTEPARSTAERAMEKAR